jgi:transposase InsO family protein
LEKAGVIEKSKSPWWHLPVVVPKRGGGSRIAINYRLVNGETEFDALPFPRIEDLLQECAGARWFSSLDFSQFYHQLPLVDTDRPKTAFAALGELWQFKRCPFGLKNAVNYCMRVMKKVLYGLDGVLIYLDDLLIIGKTREEHDNRLKAVLERIRKHGLSLNSSKCKFSQTEVSYLGHFISNGQIRPDPTRTQPIRECHQPSSLPELERFIGMANYFRSYVPNFAEMTRPLYSMKRTGKLEWNEEAVKAFTQVKASISEAILDIPSCTEKLKLRTDASNNCIAAFLENDKGKPVAFASRLLSDTEQKYDIVEKEALAIFWSIAIKFRWILLGREFEIYTDHKPLVYLLSTTKVSPKVMRWRLQLQEFHYSIHHCPGSQNVVADSLSRAFLVTHEEKKDEGIDETHESSFLSEIEVMQNQKKDKECRALLRSIRKKMKQRPLEVSPDLWSIRRKVKLIDGILIYEEGEQRKWILPKTLRRKALILAHDSHRGTEGTLSRLRQHFYWPHLRRETQSFVTSCRVCSLVKPKFISATLTPFNVKAPMEVVAMDYVGPLPSNGHLKYFLVFIDLFSRFPEVYPCTDLSTTTLISKTRDFFARYGFPDAILTDQGTQFESKEFRGYLQRFAVKKLRTTAYHPQGNGLCERFNQTIQQNMLSLLVEKNLPRHQWPLLLPTALLSYRTTRHSATGYTPAELFLGFAVKTFANRPQLQSDRFKQACGKMENASKTRKKYYDRHAADREFHEGQAVMVRSPSVGKLALKGDVGEVIQQLSKSVVEVSHNGVAKRISVERLSPVADQQTSEHNPKEETTLWKDRLRKRPSDLKERYKA